MSRNNNLFDAIARAGTDRDYVPRITSEFRPTSATAGSYEKIAVLRWRVEHGLPLWHELDGNSAPRCRQANNPTIANQASESNAFS